MKSAKEIERYIHRMFHLSVKVRIQHHVVDGFGAWITHHTGNEKPFIRIAKNQLKHGRKWIVSLIWHEVGHIMAYDTYLHGPRSWSRCEYCAQKWALKEAKRRGYTNLYKVFIKDTRDWQDGSKHRRRYNIAAWKLKEENLI
jgi:hypothetical protein